MVLLCRLHDADRAGEKHVELANVGRKERGVKQFGPVDLIGLAEQAVKGFQIAINLFGEGPVPRIEIGHGTRPDTGTNRAISLEQTAD